MAKYHFDYWFEWGCSEDYCPCLWATDEITQETFGGGFSETDLHDLPLSENLINFLCKLGMEHDNALDWEYPPNPLRWTPEEKEAFFLKAKEGYARLRDELGEDYEIRYQVEY